MGQTHPVQVRQHPGTRQTMEDRYSILTRENSGAFLGVYDGHGGADVADILVHTISEEFFKGLALTASYEAAMILAYRAAEEKTSDYDCGATAATAFINCRKMVCANAGDCAVYVSGLQTKRLTPSHRLDNPAERQRITTAGGFVQEPYYLHRGKGLMPTRGFGDKTMREVGLHSHPDIGSYIFSPGDRRVILTTDGISDAIDCSLIDKIMKTTADPELAARLMIQEAIAHSGTDNMTVIVASVNT